jgi:hypothetical protein
LGITTIKITACYALGCPLKRYVLAFRLQCRFWVLELNVLIRERSGLLLFLVLLWVVHGQNQDLASTLRTSIQRKPQPYNKPMSILCLRVDNVEVIAKLLLYWVYWVFCRVLSKVNVGTHKEPFGFK